MEHSGDGSESGGCKENRVGLKNEIKRMAGTLVLAATKGIRQGLAVLRITPAAAEPTAAGMWMGVCGSVTGGKIMASHCCQPLFCAGVTQLSRLGIWLGRRECHIKHQGHLHALRQRVPGCVSTIICICNDGAEAASYIHRLAHAHAEALLLACVL